MQGVLRVLRELRAALTAAHVLAWLFGAAVGFAVAATLGWAGGETVVEAIGTLIGAAIPVAGAAWIATSADRREHNARLAALRAALEPVANLAKNLWDATHGADERRLESMPPLNGRVERLRGEIEDIGWIGDLIDSRDVDARLAWVRMQKANHEMVSGSTVSWDLSEGSAAFGAHFVARERQRLTHLAAEIIEHCSVICGHRKLR